MLNFGNNTEEALAWLHGNQKQPDNKADNLNVYRPKTEICSSITIDQLEFDWGGTIVCVPGRRDSAISTIKL